MRSLQHSLLNTFKRTASARPAGFATTDPKATAQLRAQFRIETQYATVDQAQTDEIEAAAADFIKTVNWTGLDTFLTDLDQSRAATPGGLSHLGIAVFYIRGALCEAYEAPSAQNIDFAFSIPQDTLDGIAQVREILPSSYALAALHAQLHLDTGWTARVADPAAMASNYQTAHEIITEFDPFTCNSPFLAEIQYRLCIGLPDGFARLPLAFTDWRDLDPKGTSALQHHAFNCLPHMFGSLDILEHEVRRSGDPKDYALMMIQAMRFEPNVVLELDPFLLLAGLERYFTTMNSDAYCVTSTLRDLVAAITTAKQQHDGADTISHLCYGLGAVLRKHLTVFCSPAWQGGDDVFLEWAACAFAPELAEGSRVTLDRRGKVSIAQPEQVG